jgi:hypothetical protein
MVWPIIAGAAYYAQKRQNKRDRRNYEKAQKDNKKREANYYLNLRKAAEKGGINPLTALRSGGGSGYSSLAGRITQPLMTRDPLAAGISAASNFYQNYLMTRNNQKFESQMQNQRFAHDERMTRLNASLNRANNLSEKDKERTSLNIFGFETNPANIDDAEIVEQRYGDIISWAYGLGVLVSDTYKNIPYLTRNAKGMEPMDLTGFEIPFANGIEKSGNRTQVHINNFAN